MKINNYQSMGIQSYKKNFQKDKFETSNKQLDKQDKVEISSQAKKLQEQSKVEENRSEKVERLKQQVQSGEYKVDAEETAKGIIKFFFNK